MLGKGAESAHRTPLFKRNTRARVLACSPVLLQQKLFEQQHPNQVHPAEDKPEKGDDNTYNEAHGAALFHIRRPPDDYLDSPVDKGDQQ